ncbi:hypothetical protein HD554DRAFT_2328979 [Boletus coccyginus]|nr:hypothetical protein HD554DRAFT_2328979 [Boletus coccyginus]
MVHNATHIFLSEARGIPIQHLWPVVLGDRHKKGYEQEPERKGGFVNSLMNNARRAATKEVTHVVEDEAKQVENQLNNNNGSQPQPTDTSSATVISCLSEPTNWVDGMVDSAKQKMQGQNGPIILRRCFFVLLWRRVLTLICRLCSGPPHSTDPYSVRRVRCHLHVTELVDERRSLGDVQALRHPPAVALERFRSIFAGMSTGFVHPWSSKARH